MTKPLFLSTLFFLLSTRAVFSADLHAGASASLNNQVIAPDARVLKLKSYLESHNSPLSDSAQSFVDTADKYHLDWRLLPAISGVESTFAKHYPKGSYNPFGWGIYGGKVLRFPSFEQAIEAVASGLATRYPAGSTTNITRLAYIYNGVTPQSWSGKTQYFMEKISSHTVPDAPSLTI